MGRRPMTCDNLLCVCDFIFFFESSLLIMVSALSNTFSFPFIKNTRLSHTLFCFFLFLFFSFSVLSFIPLARYLISVMTSIFFFFSLEPPLFVCLLACLLAPASLDQKKGKRKPNLSDLIIYLLTRFTFSRGDCSFLSFSCLGGGGEGVAQA